MLSLFFFFSFFVVVVVVCLVEEKGEEGKGNFYKFIFTIRSNFFYDYIKNLNFFYSCIRKKIIASYKLVLMITSHLLYYSILFLFLYLSILYIKKLIS